MKKLMIILGLCLSALACQKGDIDASTACSFTYPPGNDNHPKAARLRDILNKYNKLGLPGISLLVRDGSGSWIGAAGMADIEKNIPFQPCTVAKVASITKMFTGTLVHLLVEQHTFKLDDKVDAFLDEEVLDKVKNCRGATIRQLMNHTTGIYDLITSDAFYLALLNDPDKKWSAEELIKFTYGKEPKFELGKSCFYSNTNTLLLSMVIQKATGRTNQDLLREKILHPLGMNDTYYYSHDELPPITAQGYFDLYNNQRIVNVTNFNTGSGNGYGGFFSTVLDLQKFIEPLLRTKTILTAGSMVEMTNFIPEADPEDPANDLNLGAGLMKRYFNQPLTSDKYGYGHTGRDLGYSANAFYFPNYDVTCCFMVNYGTNAESELREVFFDFQDELTDALFN
ncbi:MAG TPA: serine hydrolase domain-containing protein [Saprospiraceae bacterium]|nr:serine hydrolase domain-containing protein [Saprospiraceae bacterium]HNT22106.1 serine hydrolase domain-containing protein [Saprospiraceae bacterium]